MHGIPVYVHRLSLFDGVDSSYRGKTLFYAALSWAGVLCRKPPDVRVREAVITGITQLLCRVATPDLTLQTIRPGLPHPGRTAQSGGKEEVYLHSNSGHCEPELRNGRVQAASLRPIFPAFAALACGERLCRVGASRCRRAAAFQARASGSGTRGRGRRLLVKIS